MLVPAWDFITLLADVPDLHDRTFYILAGDWFARAALAMLGATHARTATREASNLGAADPASPVEGRITHVVNTAKVLTGDPPH
jgi:hypothetical protein